MSQFDLIIGDHCLIGCDKCGKLCSVLNYHEDTGESVCFVCADAEDSKEEPVNGT